MKLAAVAPALVLVALAGPAAAFDCARASTAIEKAICGDAQALAANDRMETAFFAMRDRLRSTAGADILRDGQRAWLKWRDRNCGAEAACLASESDGRAREIAATPPDMAPFFLYQPPGPKRYSVTLQGYRFHDGNAPGAAAFNGALDELLAQAPLGDDEEVEADREYAYDIWVGIGRMTPRLISAVVSTYAYSGGAHPNGWTQAINIDRAAGDALAISDLFDEATLAELESDCERQVVEGKPEEYSGDMAENLRQLAESYGDAVGEHVRDISRWHFGEEAALVQFDSYAIGPYAAGPFECRFEWADVRQSARDPSVFD